MGLPLVSAERAAARARAAIAYAGLEHGDVAKAAGMSLSMIRRITSKTTPRDATIERLWAIADVCEVPRAFMEKGWDATTKDDDRIGVLEQRMSSIETLIHQRLGRELRDSIHEILEDVEQQRDADRQRTSRRTTESG